MEEAWLDNLRRPDNGQPYQVFGNKTLTRWKQWVGGEFEFDGAGLRDVVDANAYALEDLKSDFDGHRTSDNARHAALASKVAALEAQQVNPFGG